MEIREIQNEERIDELVKLHQHAFPAFFLTQLGSPFLKTLYKGYLDDKESGIIIAEDKEQILGFIAYSNNYPQFYKGLIKHKIIQFAWCSFLATIRHPSFAKRLIGAFKKSDSVVKKEKYVELASICTDPTMEGKGVGTALVKKLISIVDFCTFSYISLETDAENNDKANKFYQKNGFMLVRQYITPEGRQMNEYHYTPGENE